MNADISFLDSAQWDSQMPERMRWLRENEPVHWSERDGVWVLSKFADVAAVSKNQALFTSEQGVRPGNPAKLAEARSEAEVVRVELVRQGEAERQRLVDEAKAEADKTVTELKAQVQEQAGKAKEALTGEVDLLSKMMAEKILGRAL